GIVHIDVAGGAAGGAAALGLDVEAPVADHFHGAPAVEPFELVYGAVLVGDVDFHRRPYAAPSFFCSFVELVVYWKTTRSPGETMALAACDMRAASWKPERMSLSLPG